MNLMLTQYDPTVRTDCRPVNFGNMFQRRTIHHQPKRQYRRLIAAIKHTRVSAHIARITQGKYFLKYTLLGRTATIQYKTPNHDGRYIQKYSCARLKQMGVVSGLRKHH